MLDHQCYLRTVIADPLQQALGLATLAAVATFVLLIASRRAMQPVRALALGSFAGHAALGIAIWYLMPTLVAGDAFVYEAQAVGALEARAGKEGFAILLGGLYGITGPTPVVGLLFNAALMGLLVIVVSRTAGRLGGERAARYGALIELLLPPFVWWGSQLLREAPMWILIALAADAAVAMAIEGLSWRRAAGLLLISLAMLTVRAPVAAVLVVFLAVGLILASAPRPGDHARRAALIVGSVAIALFLFPRFDALQSLETQNSASIVFSRNYLATANTGFGEQAAPTTGGLYGQLPTALPLVVFGPLPWQLASSEFAAVADTLAWWFILYLALRGFVPLRRRVGRASLVLVMPAAALLGVLALTLANFGIVIRMRAMVVVLLVPYAAVGLAVLAERRRARSYDAAPVRLSDVA
jgi:4-amino-4-deoxy-L-arabinose transferase-like glycosyltransferase